jgi:uncharacterized protein
MAIIIGRESEKKELELAYSSKEAEFIAIYGRRRIGKTFLIKNFFQAKECVYFQSTGIYKGTLKQQLARFTKELGDTFYGGASISVPDDWMSAFEALTKAIENLPKSKKIILFLDELPWMCTQKSSLLRALEYFWNRHWSDNAKVKLVVCGSAASWIIKKVIKNRGGLHNRTTRKIKLKPFSLYETQLYLKHQGYKLDQEAVVKLYMAIGGVPFYLKQVKNDLSVDQNINELLFNPDSILFTEFKEVFASLFDTAEPYVELIELIATSRQGLARNSIETKNTGKGGRLTQRLEDLENAGFITSYLPFGHKKQGVFYRVSDEYCHFYLRWIEPIKDLVKLDSRLSYWQSKIHSAEYNSWSGYAFENLCYKHIAQIRVGLGIDSGSLPSPWRYVPKTGAEERGAQIDLLFDRGDEAITLCEIKYADSEFIITKAYAENLKQKVAVFRQQTRTKKQLFLSIISSNGLKKNAYSEELITKIIDLKDLFLS